MVLNDITIQDLPKEEGLYAVFCKLNVKGESLNCLTVKRTGNIFGSVMKIFSNEKNIHKLKETGSNLFVIYETLDNIEFEDIHEKIEEWNLMYNPENLDVSNSVKIYA